MRFFLLLFGGLTILLYFCGRICDDNRCLLSLIEQEHKQFEYLLIKL